MCFQQIYFSPPELAVVGYSGERLVRYSLASDLYSSSLPFWVWMFAWKTFIFDGLMNFLNPTKAYHFFPSIRHFSDSLTKSPVIPQVTTEHSISFFYFQKDAFSVSALTTLFLKMLITAWPGFLPPRSQHKAFYVPPGRIPIGFFTQLDPEEYAAFMN